MRRSMVSFLILTFAVALYGGEKPRAAAAVGEVVISEDDLNRAVGNKLMKLRTEEYNLRRSVLETLIEERLLAAEAARRGMTPDALVKSEIESRVTTQTAAEIEPFYEASKQRFGAMSPEEAMDQIAANMRARSVEKRRAEFVASLRNAARVKVLLKPPRTVVDATGPSRGAPNAPVTIVEFSDFECQFCGRSVATLKKVEQAYGDKVRVVYRDFPLESHRGAIRAAEAAHCAADQEKFWPMHDKLYSKQGVTEADIRRYATDLGLDAEKFGTCLQSGKFTANWKASQAEGVRAGVVSTPTFFINGRMVAGAAPFDHFARIIEEELAPPADLR